MKIRDPDPDQYQNSADRMRMLSQVLHMLEYWANFFYIHSNASFKCYSFSFYINPDPDFVVNTDPDVGFLLTKILEKNLR
jgi:hypothetical protein